MQPFDQQTAAVVALALDVVGADLLGAYQHGSFVLGGLRPSSDVDLLVVVRRSLLQDERLALVTGLRGLSGRAATSGPARPVELTVVVQSEVRPWRFPPVLDLTYGEWLRADYDRGFVPQPEPSADLAVLITMVLQGEAVLVGPPPADVLDPVPVDDVRRAAVAGIPALLDDLATDTRNVVLTLARIWTTVATGRVVSKDAAADWVMPHLPTQHRQVLERARQAYLTQTYDADDWADLRPLLRPHCDHVVEQIEACLRR